MTTITITSGLGYPWPDEIPGATEFEPELVANVRGNASTFDGSVQTIETPGARWRISCRWSYLKAGAEANAMMTLVALMRGGAAKIEVPWFWRRIPQGTLRGAPTVNASGTAGKVLALANCTIGATLEPGDMLGLETGQVVMVEESVTALTTSMLVRVSVPIRTVPPNGSLVTWDDPRMVMMAATPSNKLPTMSAGMLKNVELVFVEKF